MLDNNDAFDAFKKVFAYDPDTGHLHWAVSPARRVKAGDRAGLAKNTSGYLTVQLFGQQYLVHRVVWVLAHGVWPTGEIDHINGVKDDNRLLNLRDVSHAQNMQNKKIHKNNTSGVAGVGFLSCKNKWRARINVCGSRRLIGYFDTFPEAVVARKTAESKYGYSQRHGRA